jgi:tetratricopeptide (TPR) repeat protein
MLWLLSAASAVSRASAMGTKPDKKGRRKTFSRPAAVAPKAAPQPAGTPRSRTRLWTFRLLASVVFPSLLIVAIELALRVVGFGYPTRFFIPSGDGKTLTTNPRFAWQFYPPATATSPILVRFAKEKPPGVLRIFVLGESAAAGTPDPAFGFARMLESMLGNRHPTHRFEVINAAMRGVDSHMVRRIARECAELSPDLFVVYLGNNEMIGRHSPSPERRRLSANIHWLRFQDALRRFKLAQLIEWALAGKRRAPARQDMEYLRRQRLAFDDLRRAPVYRHFEANLRDICRQAERVGVRTLLCTVGVNLRDFPPVGSLHRRDLSAEQLAEWESAYAAGIAAESRGDFPEALSYFQRAAQVDDQFAELAFRMAGCEERLGNTAKALAYFAQARDWDALQFRADSRLNGIVRKLGAEPGPNLRLVDLEQKLAESALAPSGVPGARIFNDHVHFTFEGDYAVASALATEAVAALQLAPAARSLPTLEECTRRLAYTPVNEMNVKEAFARLLANPPFLDQLNHAARLAPLEREVAERRRQLTGEELQRAVTVYREALAAWPDDWMLRYNLANLLSQFGQFASAEAEYARLVKQFPDHCAFRVALGHALLGNGRAAEAGREFAAAVKLNPHLKAAQEGLAAARARMR